MAGHYYTTPILEKLLNMFGYDGHARFTVGGFTYSLEGRSPTGASLVVSDGVNAVTFHVDDKATSHPVFEKFMASAVKWACDSMGEEAVEAAFNQDEGDM